MYTSQNIYDASTVYTMPSSNLNKTSRSSAADQLGHKKFRKVSHDVGYFNRVKTNYRKRRFV